jgi:hypothetical protein
MTLTLVYATLLSGSAGGADALMAVVPSDAAVAVTLVPRRIGDRDTGPGGVALVGYLLQQAGQLGATAHLDTTARIVADVLGSVPAVSNFPTSVCLLEARARPLPSGGNRLAGLRGAAVFRTGGRNASIAKRIQELLDLYTDQENSKIRKRGEGEEAVFTLVDFRFPDWLVVQWGAIGPWYVVSVGRGAFDEVAGSIREPAGSLASDSWYVAARGRSPGPGTFLRIYVNVDRLRSQLGPVMTGTPDRVVSAVGLGGLQKGLWTVGRSGRFVDIDCVQRRHGDDRFVPITVPVSRHIGFQDVIPDQATSCTVLDLAGRDLILGVRDGWLASRSESTRERWGLLWDRHVADPGWSVHDDFLHHLGDRVVLHNDPKHPLGIPLLCTILIEIDGSSEAVQDSIDRLMAALQHYFTPRPDDPDHPTESPPLRRASDGVWYVQAGLLGPALAVTPRWIVISYAPAAVRKSVRFLTADSIDRATTKPADP